MQSDLRTMIRLMMRIEREENTEEEIPVIELSSDEEQH